MPKKSDICNKHTDESTKDGSSNGSYSFTTNGSMDGISKPDQQFLEFKSEISDLIKPDDFMHQDHFLRKWLIAREWNVKKAVLMFRESMAYREKMDCANLLENYKAPEVVEKYLTGGFCGFDKKDSVVRVELFGHLDMKGMMHSVRKVDLERVKLFECEQIVEIWRNKTKELGRTIDGMTVILNLENMSSRIMWKPGIDMYLYMVKVLEDNYPEMVKHLFVVNAPSIFPILWKICRPLISEDMKRKIHVLGNNYAEVLLQYIDADQLPKFLGGTQTDPDGNPRCISKIGQGGIIPESYYQKELSNTENLERVTVPRSDKLELRYNVELPGCVLRWEFKTDDYDIGFGIDFEDKDGKRKTLREVDRVNSHMIAEDGSIACSNMGTYILVFSNHFSWARSKDICYHVELVRPDSGLNQELNEIADKNWDNLAGQLKNCTL